jgi:flagellin
VAEIGGAGVPTPLGAFNGITLFGASATGSLSITIGEAVGQDMSIDDSNLRIGDMLAIIQQDAGGAYTLESDDLDSIQKITDAIQHVAQERASLGASQSRLELASTTLNVQHENLSSAISRIRDVDVAEESTQYAKYNILVQSGTAMLAQANQTPRSVLQLLQS